MTTADQVRTLLLHAVRVQRRLGWTRQVVAFDAHAHPLRIARLNANLTVSGLSKLAGTSRNTVHDIEAGRAVPRRATAEKLAAALGIRVGDIT